MTFGACDSAAFTFWSYGLLVALITMSLAILVLLGPTFVRDVRALFVGDVSPSPPVGIDGHLDALARQEFESDLARARDAEIQELQ